MKLKHVFLGSVAASGFMLIATLTDPAVFRMFTEAQAATNVSVNLNLGTFYDRLSPYGDWVFYGDHYVWLPENVSPHWRPYTEGHWVFTRRHGWLWVSDERFGWATYHYGRWGYGQDIGWYWVPGRRWAPAWVAWSHGGDDVAWAPLPPGHDDDVNISISFGDIPDYYWQAVPVSAFLSIDLSGHVSRDRDHVRNVIRRGDRQSVRIENNVLVNTGVDVGLVEKHTRKKVLVLEEKPVDNPDAAGKADGQSVSIFNPEVNDRANAKPGKIRKITEIAKERKAKGVPQLEHIGGQGEPPVLRTNNNAQPDIPAEAPLKKSKKKDKGANTLAPADTQLNFDQPASKKKKKNKGADTFGPDDAQPIFDQPSGKKKQKTGSGDRQGLERTLNAPADGQTPMFGKNKKNNKAEQPAGHDKIVIPPCNPALEVCPPATQ